MCGCTCCRICYRRSCWGFGSVIQIQYIFYFPSIPSVSACLFSCLMFCFKISDSVSLKLELLKPSLQCPTAQLDIFDIVSNIYSVPVSCGLDAVVYSDSQPSLLTPFISLCVPFPLSPHLYSERFFVRLNKSGLPKSPEKTERQCTLFVVSSEHELVFVKIDW